MNDKDPRQLRRSLLRLLAGVAFVVVIGLAAGYAFGRTDARRAAGLVVADFVADEPIGTATEGPAPTSGVRPQVDVACGVQDDPLSVAEQIAALRAGVIVVQYRDEGLSGEVAAWTADRNQVVAAFNADLDDPVVATAWGRRLRISHVNEQLLGAFVTAYAGTGPDDQACR
jgi:hypothetical protein